MVGKAEMGQHVGTAMAQIVAEELEADWRKCASRYPDNDPKFNDPVLGALITGGSGRSHELRRHERAPAPPAASR